MAISVKNDKSKTKKEIEDELLALYPDTYERIGNLFMRKGWMVLQSTLAKSVLEQLQDEGRKAVARRIAIAEGKDPNKAGVITAVLKRITSKVAAPEYKKKRK